MIHIERLKQTQPLISSDFTPGQFLAATTDCALLLRLFSPSSSHPGRVEEEEEAYYNPRNAYLDVVIGNKQGTDRIEPAATLVPFILFDRSNEPKQ